MLTPHVIEVALLMLAAFLIGGVVGLVARRLFLPPARGEREAAISAATISAAAAGAAAAAGHSVMAEQARDPGEPAPVAEDEATADQEALRALDGIPPGEEPAEEPVGDASSDDIPPEDTPAEDPVEDAPPPPLPDPDKP